jgi:hypothetical protein
VSERGGVVARFSQATATGSPRRSVPPAITSA